MLARFELVGLHIACNKATYVQALLSRLAGVRAAPGSGAHPGIPRSTMDEYSTTLRGEGDADRIGSVQTALTGDGCRAADKRLVKHFGFAGDCPISRTMA